MQIGFLRMDERKESIKTCFGTMFFIANQIEIICDRHLSKHNLTMKQFFLSLVLLNAEKKGKILTISQVSKFMGTSRQNTKQLAIKLEERGFCTIYHDKLDKRIQRIEVTKKNKQFWKSIDSENSKLLNSIYQNISDNTLKSMAEGQMILWQSLQESLNPSMESP
jgi:DNA-binding MarR family transcriptional regulator